MKCVQICIWEHQGQSIRSNVILHPTHFNLILSSGVFIRKDLYIYNIVKNIKCQ